MRLRGRLGALQEPQFRLLWLGQTTSSLGDSMIGVALAFAVFDLGGSAGELGLVLAAFYGLGPVVCEDELGGATDWGLIVAAGAVGGTIGSVLALRIRPRYPLRFGYPLVVLAAPQLLALVTPLPAAAIAAASVLAYAGISLAVIGPAVVAGQDAVLVVAAALLFVGGFGPMAAASVRMLARPVASEAA